MASAHDESLAAAARSFARAFTKAARASRLRPTFMAWNDDGYVDPSSTIQVIRVAVERSSIHAFSLPAADLIKGANGDSLARSSLNQVLQRIIARLANEITTASR